MSKIPRSTMSTMSTLSTISGMSRIRSTIGSRLEKFDKTLEDPKTLRQYQIIGICYNAFFFLVTSLSIQIVAYGVWEAFYGDCYDSKRIKYFMDASKKTYKCSGEAYFPDNSSDKDMFGKLLMDCFLVSLMCLQAAFIFGVFGVAYLHTFNMHLYAFFFNVSTILLLFTFLLEQITSKKGPMDYFNISPVIIGAYVAFMVYEEIIFVFSIYVFVRYKNTTFNNIKN